MNPKNPPMLFLGVWLVALLLGGLMLLMPAVFTRIQPNRSAVVFAQAFGVLVMIQASIVMGGCGLACGLDNVGAG